MSTPRWSLFVVAVVLVTAALLVLSRHSAGVIDARRDRQAITPSTAGTATSDGDGDALPGLPSGRALAANVALTHGIVAAVLAVLVWYAAVPLAALGVAPPAGRTIASGVGLGGGLYLVSEATTAAAARLGVEYDEGLRELLAPSDGVDWALLLGVSLPLIAIAEELLFRAILIGALSIGLGAPPWLLVVGSSILFGLGHSAQGQVGQAVTMALGMVLGTAFVLTGSLAVVVIAHYVVDALEFGIREGLLD